MVQHCPYRWV